MTYLGAEKTCRRFDPAVFVFVCSSRFEGVHLYEGDVIPSLITLSGYSAQRITYIHIDANWLPFNFLRANRLSLIDTDVGGVRVVRRHLPEGAFDDGPGYYSQRPIPERGFFATRGFGENSHTAPLPDASPRPQQRYHRSGGSWSWACRSGIGWKKLGRDFHIFLPLDHFANRVCVFVRS